MRKKSYIFYRSLLFVTFVLLSFLGCSKKEEGSPVKAGANVSEREDSSPVLSRAAARPTKIFLKESMKLSRFELPAEALSVWRTYADQNPKLLLLSDDLMITRIPENLRAEGLILAGKGSPEELARSSFPEASNPTILPGMSVGLALESGFYDGLIWVLPFQDPASGMNVSAFREDYLKKNLFNENEANSLKVNGNILHGTVRSVEFTAAALQNIHDIDGPVIVHIDQSYFGKLYKNDVSTPIIGLIYETLRSLRTKNIPVLAVTFSYGNLDDRIGLDVRFSGDLLADIVANPSLLDQPVPAKWEKQGKIFYLHNFFRKDLATKLVEELVRDEPDKSWVKYSLYRNLATIKKGRDALKALEEAVALDRVYALEYSTLADRAYEAGQKEQSLKMLTLVVNAIPENATFKLQQAKLAAELGRFEHAHAIVEELKNLQWNKEYYPNVASYLNEFSHYLNSKSVQR